MPDFEVLIGQRVVSNAPVTTDELALAFAPDDMFVIGINPIRTDDPHAIVERELGFSGRWFTWEEFDATVRPHIEWSLPLITPAFTQGYVAGVPAKVYLTDRRVLVLCATAYADELSKRLA